MLDSVDLGSLERYKEMLTRYHSRYGPGAWLLLYQADVRARSEHVQRTMLVLSTRHDAARSAGGTTAYDPSRPWNHTWASVVDDSHWWVGSLRNPPLVPDEVEGAQPAHHRRSAYIERRALSRSGDEERGAATRVRR